eukprot:UN03664
MGRFNNTLIPNQVIIFVKVVSRQKCLKNTQVCEINIIDGNSQQYAQCSSGEPL